MKLVGVYVSPFVRRVAIALNLYGMAFEQIAASVVDGRETIGHFNGLVRVPALVLDDGEVLIDSHQILAELDRQVGPDRAMVPHDATLLRSYGQMVALLTGSLEKAVATFYESRRRPTDKIWPDWAKQCHDQAIGGALAAEARADDAVLSDGFLFGGRLTHADIAATLVIEMLSQLGGLEPALVPKLTSLAHRLGATSAFSSTRP